MAQNKLPPTKENAILSLDPNAKFSQAYDGTLTWHSDHVGTPPTDSAIATELTRLRAAWDGEAVLRTRKTKYKLVDEQLDQLYHDMLAGKLDATGEWAKGVKAVKDANPKS